MPNENAKTQQKTQIRKDQKNKDQKNETLQNRQRYWWDFGACKGLPSEWWFPQKGEQDVVKNAKRVCARCIVKDECIEWGIEYENIGIWGGLSPHQLKAERRKRNIKKQLPLDLRHFNTGNPEELSARKNFIH